MPRRVTSRTIRLALSLLVLAAACTNASEGGEESSFPSAAEAAEAFAAGMAEEDYDSVVESMRDITGREWTSLEFGRWLERRLDAGLVSAFTFEVDGEVREPAAEDFENGASPSVEVPYTITYESEASTDPVAQSGDFFLTFDPGEEQWVVEWSKGLLWPETPGAARFKVTTKWPRRAAILDRNGRPLARGPAAERKYPSGSVGGSLVGHVETVTKPEAETRTDGALPGDLVGGSGLEEGLNDRLAGSPGYKLQVVDSGGSVLEVLGRVAPERAESVKTTIDIDVQRGAENAFGDTVGGVAVIDPRKGDLLAAVGSGAFSPGNYVGATGVQPFNRGVVGRYPPGSSMKVVTAAAALEEGVVTPDSPVTGPKEYQGVRNFESGEFGAIPFATATKFSVNTAFAQVAQKLGAEKMFEYAERFGFNETQDVPLEVATSSFPQPEGVGDLMWASIGQAQVLATPVQMATVAGTIAKGGKRMDLRVTRDEKPSGERVVSRRTAGQVASMMEDVVVGGTGSGARIAGVRVAGKTGTAEVDVDGKRKNHAWFITFAPVEAPRVAVAVVAELGGIGGRVAAPLAGQTLINVLPLVE
jgi:peptidoglycan glycosyltransferase